MSLPNDGSTSLTEPRVLIICRESSLRRYMAEVLALEDYAVQVAIDAEQGWAWLQRATEELPCSLPRSDLTTWAPAALPLLLAFTR
jgi:DNA-binding NtrC family response regulator